MNGRFILTGSQKFSLMQGVSESMAGRCGVLELEGLTIEELGPVFSRVEESEGRSAENKEAWFRNFPDFFTPCRMVKNMLSLLLSTL